MKKFLNINDEQENFELDQLKKKIDAKLENLQMLTSKCDMYESELKKYAITEEIFVDLITSLKNKNNNDNGEIKKIIQAYKNIYRDKLSNEVYITFLQKQVSLISLQKILDLQV